MEGADNTATGSKRTLAAVVERGENRDSNAGNYSHFGLFSIVLLEAKRFARAHHHPRVNG